MGIRGELYTEHVKGENRTYFFNVKENTKGDVFLQIVESKLNESSQFERHAVVIFESEMQSFLQGFDKCIEFIEKNKTKRFKEIMKKKEIKRMREEGSKTSHPQKNNKRTVARVKKSPHKQVTNTKDYSKSKN